MAKHQESDAKQATRKLLFEASESLGRKMLTYLGMPAEEALDIKALRQLLRNVICVADTASVLDETARNVAPMPLAIKRFEVGDVWEYLRDKYPAEELFADITFLDFYGGGIVKADPFATEIAGLRSFFAKQARLSNKAFVFAWTYMPHDKGTDVYMQVLKKQKLSDEDLALLRTTAGVTFRSIALRLVLRQIFEEHGFLVKMFHHLLYKRVMNTMILIISKGIDPLCQTKLLTPEKLLAESYYVYDGKSGAPRLMSLLDKN